MQFFFFDFLYIVTLQKTALFVSKSLVALGTSNKFKNN